MKAYTPFSLFIQKPVNCNLRLFVKRLTRKMLTEEIVASRIRAIRVANNYSQYYMAYKLGISQNTFSKIEIGNVKLTLSRLIDIAKVLEIAPDELLKYQPEPKLEIGG